MLILEKNLKKKKKNTGNNNNRVMLRYRMERILVAYEIQ